MQRQFLIQLSDKYQHSSLGLRASSGYHVLVPSMAPTTPTILALKQNFLTAQTRILSQPLQPSRAWQRANAAADNDENDQRLSEKAVDDALSRLNHTLQQHNKRVYPPQATRHVAEQIEGVYLAAGDRRAEDDEGARDDSEDAWRFQGADYGWSLAHEMSDGDMPRTDSRLTSISQQMPTYSPPCRQPGN